MNLLNMRLFVYKTDATIFHLARHYSIMLNNQVALQKAYQVAVGGTDLVAAAGRHT
ncbi:MAG TPA: hypothetical protein VHR86_03800 [Armatimonadota bacterium]|nr:hypothetical protein [Armatimonadota bacterium]